MFITFVFSTGAHVACFPINQGEGVRFLCQKVFEILSQRLHLFLQVLTTSPTKARSHNSQAESSAVLDLTDPQQMAALLGGYINEDPLTSTAETINMINALSVDTSEAADSSGKATSTSPVKSQNDAVSKSVPMSTSPKQGVKTITYTLARSGANTVTSSASAEPRSKPSPPIFQPVSGGSNHVVVNGSLKASPVSVLNVSSSNKCSDSGTEPMNASDKKLLEEMDKPFRCEECGDSFKYAFTLEAHEKQKHNKVSPWEKGVLVPYGKGVKSIHLPREMPMKPFGCRMCQETFR